LGCQPDLGAIALSARQTPPIEIEIPTKISVSAQISVSTETEASISAQISVPAHIDRQIAISATAFLCRPVGLSCHRRGARNHSRPWRSGGAFSQFRCRGATW
jgi:hypothetical protein